MRNINLAKLMWITCNIFYINNYHELAPFRYKECPWLNTKDTILLIYY